MRFLPIILFLLLFQESQAQQSAPDSLIKLLENASDDSSRYNFNRQLSEYYFTKDRKKALEFSREAVKIARNNKQMLDVAFSLDNVGYYLNKGNLYGEAYTCYIEGIRLAEDPANEEGSWQRPIGVDPYKFRMQVLAGLHHDLGHVHWSTGNHKEAIREFRNCLHYLDRAFPSSYNSAYLNIGGVYLEMQMLDSALYYEQKELTLYPNSAYSSIAMKYVGDVYFRKGNMDSALYYYHKGLQKAIDEYKTSQIIICQLGLVHWHLAMENKDSSLYYATAFLNGIKKLQGNPLKDINISNAYELLYSAYKLHDEKDSTMKYLQLAFYARDSISRERIHNLAQYKNLTFAEQIRLEELENEKIRTLARTRIYALTGGLLFIFVIALILFRNARQKQRANSALQKAFSDLKATQSQLVHAEKMASLGELTAGIAHEIQNPLNFVNNFSEVNRELITELNEELDKGELEEVKIIADNLAENEEKIAHHGKRADAIVKNMLQHSQAGNGQKQVTNINALADEFLRLSYHGLRAKDKSFNADFKADLDPQLPQIEVVPQDIGRVLLNLINNAFQACAERSRVGVAERSRNDEQDYKPAVIVYTTQEANHILIQITDNGSGIPDTIRDKIFQPFFTTKPTGEGTGLGLSLSYDIITKGHGGTLEVESEEGKGTTFSIRLNI